MMNVGRRTSGGSLRQDVFVFLLDIPGAWSSLSRRQLDLAGEYMHIYISGRQPDLARVCSLYVD